MSVNTTDAAEASATHSPDSGTPKPTVRVKRCCGVLAGEICDCTAFAAEARGVFAPGRVIMCRPASEWGV